jgi:hypothetical protein
MRKEEMIERGFSADDNRKILDDFGNEYRNEDGEIEFLEKTDEELFEEIYKKYDGKFGDLVGEFVELTKEKESLKRAYHLLMDYWDCIPDEEKKDMHRKLEEIGL